ncbi:TPA: hypothetical protein ACOEVN_003270 [Klebsiella pneumoniae]
MTERGMIFNAEMVRALLDGRKTQTRRIMKVQPVLNGNFYEVFGSAWSKGMTSIPAVPGHSLSTRCPFGAVGDRIWVRKGFFPAPLEMQSEPPRKTMWNIAYRDGMQMEKLAPAEYNPTIYNYERWTPSIHMPRWASRILLEITDVRVERLNAINEHDAQAEGVAKLRGGFWKHYQPGWTQHQLSARGSFVTLWKSIYGDESWNSNPWVWVISFERIEGGAA